MELFKKYKFLYIWKSACNIEKLIMSFDSMQKNLYEIISEIRNISIFSYNSRTKKVNQNLFCENLIPNCNNNRDTL